MSQQQNKSRPAITGGQALAIAGGLLAIAVVVGVGLYVIGGAEEGAKKSTKKKATKKKSSSRKS